MGFMGNRFGAAMLTIVVLMLVGLSQNLQATKIPEWVKPGIRITFWCGMVSIEGTREEIYVRDPQGAFSDYQGNRYRLYNL